MSAPREEDGKVGACGLLKRVRTEQNISSFVKKIDKSLFSPRALELKKQSLSRIQSFQNDFLYKIEAFSEEGNFLLIQSQEIVGASLQEMVIREKHLKSGFATRLAFQLLRVLIEYDRLGLAHSDIRCEKILVSKEGRLWLIDNGYSLQKTSENLSNLVTVLDELYAPPERFSKGINEKTVVFSLGMVVYFMFSGELPWYEPPQSEEECAPEFERKAWKGVCEPLKKTIAEMLRFEPAKRIGLAEVVKTFQNFKSDN